MYNYISCIPAALRHYWKDIQSVKNFAPTRPQNGLPWETFRWPAQPGVISGKIGWLNKNSSLSVSTAILPDEPRLAGFIGAKDDGSGGDNWSYKTYKAPVKSSPPTNQHPTCYRLDALPDAQPTASEHWREKLDKKFF